VTQPTASDPSHGIRERRTLEAGVVATGLLYVVWQGRFDAGGSKSPLFVGVLLAASMVFYQAALWALASLGTLRLVVLGFIATAVIGIGFLQSARVAATPAVKGRPACCRPGS